jgi:hypothetical protein
MVNFADEDWSTVRLEKLFTEDNVKALLPEGRSLLMKSGGGGESVSRDNAKLSLLKRS